MIFYYHYLHSTWSRFWWISPNSERLCTLSYTSINLLPYNLSFCHETFSAKFAELSNIHVCICNGMNISSWKRRKNYFLFVLICSLYVDLLLYDPPPTHTALLKISSFSYFIQHLLDSLQYVYVCLVMGSPALDTALQTNLIFQGRGNHVPQTVGNTGDP